MQFRQVSLDIDDLRQLVIEFDAQSSERHERTGHTLADVLARLAVMQAAVERLLELFTTPDPYEEEEDPCPEDEE